MSTPRCRCSCAMPASPTSGRRCRSRSCSGRSHPDPRGLPSYGLDVDGHLVARVVRGRGPFSSDLAERSLAPELPFDVAELLDVTLLGQAPARPNRRRSADWALHVGPSSAARAIGPLPRLATVYLAANTDPESGTGLGDLDQMARACGTQPAELSSTLDQLARTGTLG